MSKQVAAPTMREEIALIRDVTSFTHDALGFVMYSFPWGVAGTALEDQTGPDEWQVKVLRALTDGGGEAGKGGAGLGLYVDPTISTQNSLREAVQIAVASGHGVGKSALVSWIILWFMSTRPNPQIVVTANTQTQLNSKTWRELAKWHKLAIHFHWFNWTATKFSLLESPETSFAMAVPWSENNSEGFAGTHDENVLIIMDEASGIADKIWEVASGAMTTPGAMWLAFGNPTRNTGRFRECFGRYKHRWRTFQVDSRNAKMADKRILQQWVDDYGEDSDFVRIRVRGVFPRASSNQLIPGDLVAAARKRTSASFEHAPKIMGIDVAREGDDQSAFAFRQGNHLSPVERFRIPNLMQLASKAAERIREERPDAVMIDGTGMGAGVVDRLRQLGFEVISVMVGSRDVMKPEKYFNVRSEIWGKMKDWLGEDADIPDDQELEDDLIGIEYGFDINETIQLEKKKDMKKRGLASPDLGDALALTFFSTVVKSYTHKPKRKRNWRTL